MDAREELSPLETSAWKMPKEISQSAHTRTLVHAEQAGDISDKRGAVLMCNNSWEKMGLQRREEQGWSAGRQSKEE